MAWNARIMPMRTTDRSDGYALFSDIASCITWAADNGARVVNVSFDAAGSNTIQSAGSYLRNKGGVLVVAAGNTGVQQSWNPGESEVVVSATNASDLRASFSSYGEYVDVSAPGTNILTTLRGGGSGGANGTSFSTPMTSGLLALMMSAKPALSPDMLQSILFSTAVDLGTAGADESG